MSTVKWSNYRLILPENSPLITRTQNITRKEIIINLFTQEIKCTYQDKKLEYFFLSKSEPYIIGCLQFDARQMHNTKLDEGINIIQKEQDNWEEVIIIINFDENFQTVSVSHSKRFGQALPKLETIINHLREKVQSFGYGCGIAPILKKGTIKSIILEHDIYSLELSASTPNFFDSSMTQETKKAFQAINAKNFTKTFKNIDAPLELKEHINDLENEIEASEGGEVSIRLGTKDSQSTSNKIRNIFDSKQYKSNEILTTDITILNNLKKKTEQGMIQLKAQVEPFLNRLRRNKDKK